MLRFAWLLPALLSAGCAVQDAFCNLIEPDSYVFAHLGGCPTIEVSFDYDAQVPFAALETYQWLSGDDPGSVDGIRDDAQLHAWVTDAVDVKLAERGFRREQAAPDFLISYGVREEMRATLTLAFLDAGTRQQIWRGASSDEAYQARNRETWERRIQAAVDLLLEQFPPSVDR